MNDASASHWDATLLALESGCVGVAAVLADVLRVHGLETTPNSVRYWGILWRRHGSAGAVAYHRRANREWREREGF